MDLTRILDRMETFPAALSALLQGLNDEEARWRHDDEAWSIVEVMDHMVDEEELDFGPRLRVVLEDPELEFPPLDPEGVVLARRDEERDLGAALARFAELRAASMTWLRTLAGADWDQAKEHKRLGPIRAGDLLTAWADHDVAHLRQLADRLHRLVVLDSAYDPAYGGGTW